MFNFTTLICDTLPQNNVPASFFHLPKHGQNGQQNERAHGWLTVQVTGDCVYSHKEQSVAFPSIRNVLSEL